MLYVHMAGVGTCGMLWAMWQGVGASDRVLEHRVGGGGMSQGIGVYGMGGVGARCERG